MAEEKRGRGRPKGSVDKTPRKRRGGDMANLPRVLQRYQLEGDNEFNSTLASFQVEVIQLRSQSKHHVTDPDYLLGSFQEYLGLCSKYGMRITNAGAYSAMGIDRKQASEWRTGKRRQSDPRFKELIDLVDSLCSMNREQLMIENKIMPGVGIFWQKNYDGMKDEPEEKAEATVDDELKSPEQIREQYKYLIETDDAPTKP